MSKSALITIGKAEDGKPLKVDPAKLLTTRMLVTANSGGGKSFLLRKLFEQIGRTAQLIVLDMEGEFVTLREKLDLVIVGPGGEIPADVRSSGLLVRRLMERELSAVIDMSEMRATDRRRFVRQFCETLVELPKALWRPLFVGLDEAHQFAPEKGQGEAESTQAVIDLCTLGRKRGYCSVLATQRISTLNKTAAGECNNKFIGRMTLDVDIKRAAFELGVSPVDAVKMLRDREAGEFYGFGPAIDRTGVTLLKVGQVETTHPTAGKGRTLTPPKPSKTIAAVVAELTDLPKEAEAEIKDLAAARHRIAELERQLKRPAPAAAAADKGRATEEKAKRDAATIAQLKKGLESAMKVMAEIHAKGFDAAGVDPEVVKKAVQSAADQILKAAQAQLGRREAEFNRLKEEVRKNLQAMQKLLEASDVNVRVDVKHNEPFTVKAGGGPAPSPRVAKPSAAALPDGGALPKGEAAVLSAIAQHGQDGADREQLTVLTGYKRSSRDTYLQRLKERGLIQPGGAELLATDAGVQALGSDFTPLPTGSALLQHWLGRLPEGERRVLEVIVSYHPNVVERAVIDDATGYKRSSRDTYLQRLSSRRLVVSEPGSRVRASDMLFD
jgi:hypothetical protein